MTYDPTTDAGKVRLLIGDTDQTEENQIFTDAEIDAFLEIGGSTIKLAAAQALTSMAANQAMVLKVIRLLDLQTDGAATAKALRDLAKDLREEAEDDGEFDIAEWVVDGFTWEDRLRSELLREG